MRPTTAPRQALLFVLIVLCLLFVVGYASRLTEQTRLQVAIARQEARIVQAQQKQARLQAELTHVQSDAYVEQVAREQLGMVQPGDQLVIRVAPPPEAVQPAPEPSVTAMSPMPPPWQQWLELFWPSASG
jgi:cell division protein FtsL